jgi:sec-independent protein translocase protein TatB
MLRPMFGMGGSEIIVILIVALLFLGPDKLPQAAKSISKGIRDIKKQSRSLQQQIESDEQIGGAIRDLKSALRGEDAPVRPKPRTLPTASTEATPLAAGAAAAVLPEGSTEAAPASEVVPGGASDAGGGTALTDAGDATTANAPPALTMPPLAGEPDPDVPTDTDDDLGKLIRPATGTVPKGSGPSHG